MSDAINRGAKLPSRVVRQDIQGLRTIGALLVAIFHIWELGVSGGVDVFFVVSGYFLGVSSVQQITRQQTLRLGDHIGRFVRRSAPQVVLVLVAVITVGLLLIGPPHWRALLQHSIYSAIYLQNYHLIQVGQDYLARDETASLVQHFWAVALIAQAYVLWFPLMRLAGAIAHFQQRWTAPLVLTAILCILVFASLTWSIIWTRMDPSAAYFDLLTRYWQFGVGAILGLWLSGDRRMVVPTSTANALSWIGLGLVLSCGVVIGTTAAFPGYAAL
jgi:peptidoglycan/LPS O-acetylase OafA/YrhL